MMWILCKNAIPKEHAGCSETVLITVFNSHSRRRFVDMGALICGKWYSDGKYEPIPEHCEVVAWSFLPEPYKELENIDE